MTRKGVTAEAAEGSKGRGQGLIKEKSHAIKEDIVK